MTPNGHAIVHALEPGEVVFLNEGVFRILGHPQQVEAGEVWVEASPVDDPDTEMILKFSRADKWVRILRREGADR